MKVLLDGMKTGLFLQLAIGPLFFFILGITLDSGIASGISGIAAVTIVDFIYIILSILGVGVIIERSKNKNIFNIISNGVLIIFGIFFLIKAIRGYIDEQSMSVSFTPVKSFITCFILTISSPMTIIFWTSIFTTKGIENNYSKNSLAFFGLGAGIMTFIFLTTSIFLLSRIGTFIPGFIIQLLNFTVGAVVIIYGIKRLNLKAIIKKKEVEL